LREHTKLETYVNCDFGYGRRDFDVNQAVSPTPT